MPHRHSRGTGACSEDDVDWPLLRHPATTAQSKPERDSAQAMAARRAGSLNVYRITNAVNAVAEMHESSSGSGSEHSSTRNSSSLVSGIPCSSSGASPGSPSSTTSSGLSAGDNLP